MLLRTRFTIEGVPVTIIPLKYGDIAVRHPYNLAIAPKVEAICRGHGRWEGNYKNWIVFRPFVHWAYHELRKLAGIDVPPAATSVPPAVPRELLAAVRSALNLGRNPTNVEIVAAIDAVLDWQEAHPGCASDDHLVADLPAIRSGMMAFIEAEEDRQDVRTQDDAVEVAGQFRDASKLLRPYLVAERAEASARGLAERSRSLRPWAEVAHDAERNRAAARLQQKADLCRCGEKVVLREGKEEPYWSCSTFPACWSTRRLSPTEQLELRF